MDTNERTISIVLTALDALKTQLRDDAALVKTIAEEASVHPTSLCCALDLWIDSIAETSLRNLYQSSRKTVNTEVSVLTLAPGNIPIVAVEAIILGMLAHTQHTVALSTRAMTLPAVFRRTISQAAEECAATVELVVWRGLAESARQDILNRVQTVVAFGTEQTIGWLKRLLPEKTTVREHGPSFSVGYLRPSALTPEELTKALSGLAHDVAVFDQRGCRSPHALLVEGTVDELCSVRRALVDDVLPRLEQRLPRGRPVGAETTALYLDELTSNTLGELDQGLGWRLTTETQPEAIRQSPLARTLRLLRVSSLTHVKQLIQTMPAPVRLVGAAGRSLKANDLPGVAEVVPLGALQLPKFDRLHDGRHRLDELVPEPSEIGRARRPARTSDPYFDV